MTVEGRVPIEDESVSDGLPVRAAHSCAFDLLAFGEVMLRFDPGERRIVGAHAFDIWEGGGEYNVARGLRRCFGLRTALASALVDNPVGRLVEDLILQGGVDASHLLWRGFDGVGQAARNGIYFLERGFGVRRGMGMMDRGHTAVSQIKPGDFDWDAIFGRQGVRWFHTGGIMAALSPTTTEAVLEAMQAAQRHGVVVSYDGNYRPSLWHSRGGRAASVRVNRSFMPFVNVFFGHEGDIDPKLGKSSRGPVWHTAESFHEMASSVSREFPQLKIVASTIRRPHSATRNEWGGLGHAEGRSYEGMRFDDLEVLDRVGSGDAFAAGVIYGLLERRGIQWALDCGVAHGALCMTTPGDASHATLAEVERLMSGDHAGTLR